MSSGWTKVVIVAIILLAVVVAASVGPKAQPGWTMMPEDTNVLGDENAALCRTGTTAGFRYCVPIT